jgi:hypothetical protein
MGQLGGGERVGLDLAFPDSRTETPRRPPANQTLALIPSPDSDLAEPDPAPSKVLTALCHTWGVSIYGRFAVSFGNRSKALTRREPMSIYAESPKIPHRCSRPYYYRTRASMRNPREIRIDAHPPLFSERL